MRIEGVEARVDTKLIRKIIDHSRGWRLVIPQEPSSLAHCTELNSEAQLVLRSTAELAFQPICRVQCKVTDQAIFVRRYTQEYRRFLGADKPSSTHSRSPLHTNSKEKWSAIGQRLSTSPGLHLQICARVRSSFGLNVPAGTVLVPTPDKLGVSKTPVREALAQLRLEGLVRASPPRGVSVFTLSADEIREMCELRQALEVAAMRLAMERHPESLIAALGEVVEHMTAALAEGNIKAYLAADTLFHLRFLESCGNKHLLETYRIHVGKIAALRTHLAQKPQHIHMSFLEHQLMVEKLAAGDVAGSLSILGQHIDRTKMTYSSSIQDIAAADRAGQS